jgi:hypothetical protein
VRDVGKDLALATPGVGVAATGIMGYPWSTWSYMLTALYMAVMIVKAVWPGIKAWQAKRRA